VPVSVVRARNELGGVKSYLTIIDVSVGKKRSRELVIKIQLCKNDARNI